MLEALLDSRKLMAEKEKEKRAGGKQPTPEEEEKRQQELEREEKEIARLSKIILPKPAEKVMLTLTSVHDLILAIQRMAEYDRMMVRDHT